MENKKYDEVIVICGESKVTIGINVICVDCGKPLWMSDSSMNSVKLNNPGVDLEKHPPTVLCIDCGNKKIEKEKDADIEKIVAPLTNEQLDEFKKHFFNEKRKK